MGNASHGLSRVAVLCCLLAVGASETRGADPREALRELWLRELARWWVVDEDPEPSDAIVVLANGPDRARTAAKLYHEGYAPVILLSDARADAADPSPVPYWTNFLDEQGVPTSAIGTLPGLAMRTLDEAGNIQRWATEHNAAQVIVVTDAFHSRRARWLCQRALENTPCALRVVAAPPTTYDLNAWWTSSFATGFFRSEIVKYIYYRTVGAQSVGALREAQQSLFFWLCLVGLLTRK